MKRILFYLCMFLAVSFLAVSCEPETSFDESLLIGEWTTPSELGLFHYKYFEDGTGYTWDDGEDVNESEAQPYTWTLVNAELTQIHLMESSDPDITLIFTVTELTATTLKYHDDFGDSYSFTKVAR